jgi:hypothetical protein
MKEPSTIPAKHLQPSLLFKFLGNWPIICLIISTIFLGMVYLLGDFANHKSPNLWNEHLVPNAKRPLLHQSDAKPIAVSAPLLAATPQE